MVIICILIPSDEETEGVGVPEPEAAIVRTRRDLDDTIYEMGTNINTQKINQQEQRKCKTSSVEEQKERDEKGGLRVRWHRG